MKLNVRPLSYNDYDDILVEWWKDWGWDSPPKRDFLPQEGEGGVIVYDNTIPVCAGFIYSTNSKVAWITWIISNKKYKDKKKSLDMLISTLETISKNKGHKYMFTNNNNPALINYFSNAGYIKGTTSTELIKTIN